MLVAAAFLAALGVAMLHFNAVASTNESGSTSRGSAPSKSLPKEARRPVSFAPAAASLVLDEATLLLWDDWKARTSKATTWLEEKLENDDEPSMTNQRNHAQAFESQVQSWWNSQGVERDRFVNSTADNAERFGDQVKTWWQTVENATTAGKRSISGDSLGEKEEALEHNFQTWWEHANQVERSWWNATVQQLQNDKEIGGGWMDELKTKGGHVAEKGQEWSDSTKNTLKNDEAAAAEAERNFLNATMKNIRSDERAVESKFSLWWNTTKTMAQNTMNATTGKEEEWWNATKSWFEDHVRQQSVKNELEAAHPRPLLYLNSTFAYSLLMNGYHWYDYSADFFTLQLGWDAQINQGFCAVASSAAILNSLRPLVDLPVDPIYAPHPYATQVNLFNNDCVQEKVVHHNDTYDGLFHAPGGLSLDQTKGLLECSLADGWKVTAHHVDPEIATVNKVRRDLEEALMNPFKRVIVNFDRRVLGQEGGGHFSPLGSYAKNEDAFLVMDVAKYKYPPVWVPAERLYSALATGDSCGDWDYPSAQDKLRDDQRPTTLKEYEKSMKKLGCREIYRGYIIVEPTSEEP